MPMPRSTTTAATPTPQTRRISGRRVATVEEDGLAGHEVRARGGEEDDEGTDLLQPTRAPHRDVPRQTLVDPRIRERRLVHVGDEPSRRDRVHLHIVARPLDAERARERHHAALGRRVQGVAGQPDGAQHGGEIDDLAGATRAPAPASARAIARPSPRLAPVTTATFPARSVSGTAPRSRSCTWWTRPSASPSASASARRPPG